MDHQRNSVWVQPLETPALPADEKADTEIQTPVSFEGDMNWTQVLILHSLSAGVYAGAPSRGVIGGCRETPLNF